MPRLFCKVEGCASTNDKPEPLLFAFPKPKETCGLWVAFTGNNHLKSRWAKEGTVPRTSSRICALHFRDKDFTNCWKDVLNRGVVPSLNGPSTSTTSDIVANENSNEDHVLQVDEDTCHVEQDPPELDISEPFTPPLEDDQHEPQRNRNHYHLIQELPELYMSITLPYLEKEPLYLKWVYDVIKGEAERGRVVYESPCKDDKNGFVMIRDAEWDGEDLERLHLVALPYRPGLLTIRDLRDTHLILLKNIYNIGMDVIEERYGVPGTQLNIYLQYLPSFYHLNIHFTMLRNETCGKAFLDHIMRKGFEVQKNHLLPYVINNLELWPDYYQKATLMLLLQESHNLFFRFKKHGIVRRLRWRFK